MKLAIYPGTFDPITNGHLDIIKRALKIFDELIIAVAINEQKTPKYSLQERKKMISAATQGLNVRVVDFGGLLADFARQIGVFTIVRGLRAVSDFEYELQMHYANASLEENLETIYLMPSLKHAFISSSIVRSICIHGGSAAHLVPKEVWQIISEGEANEIHRI